MQDTLVGLLVFGGTDPVTGCDGYKDAFAEAFPIERNKAVWKKVGAVPLTRNCVNHPKVQRELELCLFLYGTIACTTSYP